MNSVNSPEFWEQMYRQGRTGWDLGRPTPVFCRLLESGAYAPGRMIVLGAGRGYDARMFAHAGFDVTAVDFAEEAVEDMRTSTPAETPLDVLHTDIFHLPDTVDSAFDYVLEYTCFCAIDPSRREEYADVVAHLLHPDGTLTALLFPVWDRSGGPPFAVSPDGYAELFTKRGFEMIHRETPPDSVSSRQGLEVLLIMAGDVAE